MSHCLSLTEAAEFMAPAEVVWDLLFDWPAIVDWMPDGYIRSLSIEGSGIGAVRHLVTGKGVSLSERLDEANRETGSLELSLVGDLPWELLSYAARGKLENLAQNRCLLVWQGSAELSEAGDAARQVERLLRASYRKMFAGIRSVVETRVR